MQRHLFSRLIFALGVFALGCDGMSGCRDDLNRVKPAAVQQGAPASRLEGREDAAHSLNQFAFELHDRLADDGNAAYSPLGIYAALSMSMAGARGETAEEMARVLHAEDVEQFHEKLGALNWYLGSARSDATAAIAQDLWVDDAFAPRPSYRKQLVAAYGASVRDVDFGDPEAAAQAINDYFARVTSGLLEEVVSAKSFGPTTRFVLTSALYFDLEWQTPFDESKTSKSPFHVTEDRAVPVEMMYQKSRFRYAFVDGVRVVELPYRGGQYSAIGILPHNETLEEVESRLDAKMFETLRDALRERPNLPVSLPRVTLQRSVMLKNALESMGIEAAFEPGAADFGGLADEDIFLSDVQHAAVFELNEAGTKASAATVATGEMAAEMMPEFIANRPFLLLIVDDATGAIVFVARIVDPR